MSCYNDPHLRRQEEFGQAGNTVKIGGEVFVACRVIGAPPLTSCPFYTESAAKNEKLYKKNLIESGEFGSREDLGKERLGFKFADVKSDKVKAHKVKKDKKLCKLAFEWDTVQKNDAKEEQEKRSREEGEKMAALKKAEAIKIQKNIKNEERKAQKIKPMKKKCPVTKAPSDQYKTHVNEGRTHGWKLPPRWGLKGGVGGEAASNTVRDLYFV